jgi:hypothetical protein
LCFDKLFGFGHPGQVTPMVCRREKDGLIDWISGVTGHVLTAVGVANAFGGGLHGRLPHLNAVERERGTFSDRMPLSLSRRRPLFAADDMKA